MLKPQLLKGCRGVGVHSNSTCFDDPVVAFSLSTTSPLSFESVNLVAMAEDQGRITIVVIGQSGTGKSTFYNRLASLSLKYSPHTDEGDKNGSCTSKSTWYDVDIPLVEYKIVSKQTGLECKDADGLSEVDLLMRRLPTKLRASKYEVKPRGKPWKILKLRIVDTPGLNDSRNRDFENINDVLATLNSLGQKKNEWERKIHGIVLTEYYTGSLSYSTSVKIDTYRKCMENLFRQLLIINTGFTFEALRSKNSEYVSKGIISEKESVMPVLHKERTAAFEKDLGRDYSPELFYIDNKPDPMFPYQDMASRNTLTTILDQLSHLSPMNIQQMTIQKTLEMIGVDACLNILLQSVTGKIRAKQKGLSEDNKGRAEERLAAQDTIDSLKNKLVILDAELARINDDSKFIIKRYPTGGFSYWNVFASNFSSALTGSEKIREPDHPGFQVQADDSPSGKWTSKGWTQQDVEWRGEYQAEKGKRPRLVAKSYLTNKIIHKDRIRELEAQSRHHHHDLRCAEQDWKAEFGCDTEATEMVPNWRRCRNSFERRAIS